MTQQEPASRRVVPRAKVWLELEGEYVFGLGICRILEAVDETGSIKEAAASIGKSYRHVWARVKEVERAIGIPLVATRVGGGGGSRRSALTDPARELVTRYRALRAQVFSLVDDSLSSDFQQIVSAAEQ